MNRTGKLNKMVTDSLQVEVILNQFMATIGDLPMNEYSFLKSWTWSQLNQAWENNRAFENVNDFKDFYRNHFLSQAPKDNVKFLRVVRNSLSEVVHASDAMPTKSSNRHDNLTCVECGATLDRKGFKICFECFNARFENAETVNQLV